MPKPRRPFKFWAMATVTVVFTLLGIVMVAVGPGADTRLTGLMCILFFGLGGLAYLGGPLLTRSGPGTVLRERVQTSAGSEAAFVFPTPRRKRIVVTIGMFGFTAGGALIALAGGGWIGILCAGFFGLLFLLGLFSLRRPQRLVLTPTRLLVCTAAMAVELPWEKVGDVDIYEQSAGRTSVDMLGVAAKDPDDAVWTRGRRLGRLGRHFSPYALIVGADTFAGEAEGVVEAIKRYKRDARARRSIGGEAEHARLLHELGETTTPP